MVELYFYLICDFLIDVQQVRSAYGNTYHKAEDVVGGQFAFTAPENGDYVTCLRTLEHKPELTISVDFEWKSGLEAKDWSNVAKKGSVEVTIIPLLLIQELSRN